MGEKRLQCIVSDVGLNLKMSRGNSLQTGKDRNMKPH